MFKRWESATRYYVAYVTQDLLGDWVLVCAHGGRRNRLGGVKTTVLQSETEGREKLEALDKLRRQHKYKPV